MLQAMAKYSYVGIFFGVAVFLGMFGGRWLDRRTHTEPLFTLLGLGFGVAAGFRELYRMVKQFRRDMKE